jgi:hypothetical protein
MITHHQLQVWGGEAALATGAVALVMIIMSMVAGLSYRLFMIISGRAQSARKPRRGERVPLDSMLDEGADTAELLEDDHG